MRLLSIIVVLLLFSCKDAKPIHKPANLISDKKMSALIADFAIGDQMSFLNSSGNLEISSRYILKKHNVTAKQFSESYTYYLASPKQLEEIFDNAQEIIREQDPGAEKYIEKKQKDINKNLPEFAR